MMLPFTLFLFGACSVVLARDVAYTRARQGDLAIGVHLTTSYAVAAVKYDDGRIEDLIRIPAPAEYIDLISRWVSPRNDTDCSFRRDVAKPRYHRMQCKLAQAERRTNKSLGKPATPDVGILASFLLDIKIAVERKLGFEVRHFVPVFPVLAAMQEDDIGDAMQFAELVWVKPSKRPQQVMLETGAAYAGLGYGLCESWTNGGTCWEEEFRLPAHDVLFLNFDNASFGAAIQWMSGVYSNNQIAQADLKLDLGAQNLPNEMGARLNFWNSIWQATMDIGKAGNLRRKWTKVVLLGDHAKDPEFIETVSIAVHELLGVDLSEILLHDEGADGTMVAARGAAELAMRDGPEGTSKMEEIETEEL